VGPRATPYLRPRRPRPDMTEWFDDPVFAPWSTPETPRPEASRGRWRVRSDLARAIHPSGRELSPRVPAERSAAAAEALPPRLGALSRRLEPFVARLRTWGHEARLEHDTTPILRVTLSVTLKSGPLDPRPTHEGSLTFELDGERWIVDIHENSADTTPATPTMTPRHGASRRSLSSSRPTARLASSAVRMHTLRRDRTTCTGPSSSFRAS
jgi:hypothetical protein